MTENPQWQPVDPQQPIAVAATPKKAAGGTIAICLSVLASGVLAGVLAWHPWEAAPDPRSTVDVVYVYDENGVPADVDCYANEVGLSCLPKP